MSTLIAKTGQLIATYQAKQLDNTHWVHIYTFSGGKYGEHEITCDRILHGNHGPIGRVKSHWDGYVQATTD